MTDLKYTTREYTCSISTEEYIRRFRDADKFLARCRECSNYNCSWACPPYSHDILKEMRSYSDIILFATVITPVAKDIPLSEAERFFRPERVRMEKRLLEMERRYGGRSFAFVGNCLYCPEGTCTRRDGLPCRHPDLVRPSLEAYGFDVGRTASELFGIELQWSKGPFMQDAITLVCAFFHNCGSNLSETAGLTAGNEGSD